MQGPRYRISNCVCTGYNATFRATGMPSNPSRCPTLPGASTDNRSARQHVLVKLLKPVALLLGTRETERAPARPPATSASSYASVDRRAASPSSPCSPRVGLLLHAAVQSIAGRALTGRALMWQRRQRSHPSWHCTTRSRVRRQRRSSSVSTRQRDLGAAGRVPRGGGDACPAAQIRPQERAPRLGGPPRRVAR